ncbi:MAG: DUF2334 domain-containing protein [Phycisphaerae bacterium]|nr:DUF2334 domain-containing protein [Phycisphaerae bacterium]
MKWLLTQNQKTSNWKAKLLLCATGILFINNGSLANLNVVFRYDDLSGDLQGSRTIGSYREQVWKAEKDIFDRFKTHGFHYVVSVIPQAFSDYGSNKHAVVFNLDKEKVDYFVLAEANGIAEIALHGYSHANHASKGHRQGEFRERAYLDQYKDIQAGLDILKVCGFNKAITFVPPWHGWDSNTAKALIDSNLKVLSTRSYYYTQLAEPLCFIPKTTSLEALEVKLEKDSLPQDGLIVVLFHPNDLVSKNGDACFGSERLKHLLDRLSVYDYIHIVSFKELYNEDAVQLNSRRYKASTWARNMRDFSVALLPKRICPYDLEVILPATGSLYRTAWQSWISILGFFSLSVVLLFLAALLTLYCSRILKKKKDFSPRMRLMMSLGCLLIIVCSIYQEYDLVSKGYIPVIAWLFPVIFALVLLSSFCRKPKPILSEDGV